MKRLLLIAFATVAVGASTNTKVEVCHLPPGNPNDYHTLTIPSLALKAHLAHGDLEGTCGNYCGLFCNTNDKCFQDNGVFDPGTGRCICSSAPVDCSSPSSCLTNTGCDPSEGCQYSQSPLGAACNYDNNVCTADTCDGSGTCQSGLHDLRVRGGTCSGTTRQACAYDKDCPPGEACAWTQSTPRFIDNGNGTVTDQRTCLMWEKKTSDGRSPDWVECHFNWTGDPIQGFRCLQGNVITVDQFLASMQGLAGFNDWCLPTSAGDPNRPGYATGSDPELESIVAPTARQCRPEFQEPVCYIDPIFEYTEPGGYWSSSSVPGDPNLVFYVAFNDPTADAGTAFRNAESYARAVRSRSCPTVP